MTEPLVLCVDHWAMVDDVRIDDEQCHVCKLQAELDAARKEIDLDNKIIQAADEVYHEQKAQITSLRVALKKITKPEGVYSRDHYQHAKNTIEWIIETAQDALKGGELEADRDRRIGNYEEFDTMDDLINSLEGGDEVE